MNGDSGSPLYVDKDGVDGQVVGVLSGGSGNVYGSSIVYVRTRAYLNWIRDTVQANPDSRTLTMDELSDQLVGVGGSVDLTASATSSESSSEPTCRSEHRSGDGCLCLDARCECVRNDSKDHSASAGKWCGGEYGDG